MKVLMKLIGGNARISEAEMDELCGKIEEEIAERRRRGI